MEFHYRRSSAHSTFELQIFFFLRSVSQKAISAKRRQSHSEKQLIPGLFSGNNSVADIACQRFIAVRLPMNKVDCVLQVHLLHALSSHDNTELSNQIDKLNL